MSRYDYQENPQVQYWKGQAKVFQMSYEKLRDEVAKTLAKQICEEVAKAKTEREEMQLVNKELSTRLKELEEKNKELQEDIALFNSLPWYERLFHKFD